MKNLIVESDVDAEDRFVLETLAKGPKEGVQYGLSVREGKVDRDSEMHALASARDGFQNDSQMAEVGEKRPSMADIEKRKLKEDMMLFPDEAPLDVYEQMPIEEFGEAMLRGMGWDKGKPIGRNSKVVVEPVQYVRRSGMEGLGATPLPQPENQKKFIKPGESREKKPDLVAATGSDGKIRNIVSINEKLVERTKKGVHVGKVMSIIGGRHAWLRGEVTEGREADRRTAGEVFVKLVKSGETVVVNVEDLADIGSLEEEKAMKQLREMKTVSREDRRDDKSHSRYEEREEVRERRGEKPLNKKEDNERSAKRRDSRNEDRNRSPDRMEKERHRGRHGERDASESNDRIEDATREKKYEPRHNERSNAKSNQRIEDYATREKEYEPRHNERSNTKSNERIEDHARRHRGYESRPIERGKNKSNERVEDDHARRDKGYEARHSERDNSKSNERIEDHARRDKGFESMHSERDKSTERKESNVMREKGDRSYTAAQRGESIKDTSLDPAAGKPTKPWLMSHIRVRIINKRMSSGRLYLKKARVVDVISPTVCDILLDENGELLQEVKQEYLETALPKKGGRVVVVGGKHRGLLGKLLERNSDREVALVQMEESFEMVTISLDLVAEFIGDPSDMH
ncbi:hypothetical protein O6H91_03G109000 [Diphasiastrum complanatum]|nr:hypothetical protein O6H91_03G109000 [Diphasiastrum complanatum]